MYKNRCYIQPTVNLFLKVNILRMIWCIYVCLYLFMMYLYLSFDLTLLIYVWMILNAYPWLSVSTRCIYVLGLCGPHISIGHSLGSDVGSPASVRDLQDPLWRLPSKRQGAPARERHDQIPGPESRASANLQTSYDPKESNNHVLHGIFTGIGDRLGDF